MFLIFAFTSTVSSLELVGSDLNANRANARTNCPLMLTGLRLLRKAGLRPPKLPMTNWERNAGLCPPKLPMTNWGLRTLKL